MPGEGESRTPSGRRREVLAVLRDAPGPLSINTIADRLGVHPNTVRFHLDRLVENGRVERVEVGRRTAGRPPQLFRPVRRMDLAGPRQYRLLAELLVQSLAADPDRATIGLEAGRAWGRGHAAAAGSAGSAVADGPNDGVDRLMVLLDEIGFAPEDRTDHGRRQIGLRHCPFLELAESRPAVVCPAHLGLMQGAMQAWRSPLTVDRLEPFVEPDLCLAHLAPAGGS